MAEHINVLAVQALAARFRSHAAETSIESFRRKFEAVAEELERQAGVPLIRPNSRGAVPRDRGTGREYEH